MHLSLSRPFHISHFAFIHIFHSVLTISLRKVCQNESYAPIFFSIFLENSVNIRRFFILHFFLVCTLFVMFVEH